jgi:malate dehydrogenase (oxaloacetate-decarboxylating)(NADP+)
MASGIATRPVADLKAYKDRLQAFVYRSGTIMQPVFAAASQTSRRIAFAEGEDERVLRAVQVAVEEGLAQPILIGRPDVIRARALELGLRLEEGRDYRAVSVDDEAQLAGQAEEYYQLRRRQGLAREAALRDMRGNGTLIGAMLVRRGEADGLLCGTFGAYDAHLKQVVDVIGLRTGTSTLAAMNVLMLPKQTVFIADTYINENPTAEEIAEIARLAAEAVRRFGVTPRVALLSHSSFGSARTASAAKMREALGLIQSREPDLEVEGEMQGDAALNRSILDRVFPGSGLTAEANLLVMPNLDAANITFNVLKAVAGQGITVGPILLGAARPVHILEPTSTVRRITNMTALTAVEAATQA